MAIAGMNDRLLERRCDTQEALIDTLAKDVASQMTKAVALRGAASAVVSGGTTPGPFYDRLSNLTAPWDRVVVTLADERWVQAEDDRSNARLVRARLVRNRAANARFVGLKTADVEPEQAEAAVDGVIRGLPRPFDLVLLGMGEDGHTASLFPHAPGLAAALDVNDPALARAMRPAAPDGAITPRMTLSLRALLDSRRIVILFTGQAKFLTWRWAMNPGAVEEMPVRAVLRQTSVPVEIWWAP